MNGLEKITNRILEDAKASADKIISDANEKAAEIYAAAEKKKQDITNDIFDSAMREGETIINTAKSTLDRNCKAIVMSMKTSMVDKAFEEAKNEILALDSEKYAQLMTQLLCRVLSARIDEEKESMRLYGEDISPEAYEVIMNKKDRDGQGVYIVAGVRRATVGKITGTVLDKVTLSNEVANISGGFILRMGRMEINASLEAIIADFKEQLTPEIMELLFPTQVVVTEE